LRRAHRIVAAAFGLQLAGVLIWMMLLVPGTAARGVAARVARADAPQSASRTGAGARAPSGPPLVSGTSQTSPAAEAAGASSPAGEVDPLVSNGLGSPSCRSTLAGELTQAARRNCETSGFVASADPTGNYGIDVHIDTGLFGLSYGGLLSTVQDLIVTPIWMALVWIVHALVVMLEWCFTLSLLEGDGGLGSSLAGAERYLTSPWLPLALSLAAVLLAYEGLVRRRVAESLGQALVVLVMIGAGLWVILNPAGTVGTLSNWANQAGLGTLAVAARGTPVAPGDALGVGMGGVYAATIEGPWCYLEFGNVQWCRDPTRLDRGLKEAGVKLAGEELAQRSCSGGCSESAGQASVAIEHSARLLREARTNGALFLALPSNGPQRNSINDQGSLLRELCGTDEATNCSGPTAAEAEFRTNSGTWSRVGGLLLIAVGVMGMVLLLGHIGLRLLMAAMLTLFYLLLAPGVVLAPALGERGRAVFRAWAARLFGAVASKLIFAFLLGVVLAVMTILESLGGLGWWTQWLLMAAFWWGVFLRRHQLLGGAAGFLPGVERQAYRPVGRRAGEILERQLGRRRTRGPRRGPDGAPRAARPSRFDPRPAPAKQPATDLQALSMLSYEQGPVAPANRGSNEHRERRERLARISAAQAEALGSGDRKRAARLALRRERVAHEIEQLEHESGGARTRARVNGGSSREGGRGSVRRQGAFLDAQAELPPRGLSDAGGRRRDYPALAALAGMSRINYEGLASGPQRMARLEIDRQLAARREGGQLPRSGSPTLPPERRRVQGATGSDDEVRAPGLTRPARRSSQPESEVMRDIREVEAGRKRQLGIGRP